MKTVLNPDLPILLVDDDKDVVNAVLRTLRVNGYNNFLSVNDSRKVISLLNEERVALVLLDITMPHIRGDKLLEEIVVHFPNLPVIMSTASDSIEMVVGCMKKGAFDYITKPLSTGLLLASIQKALDVRELRRENDALRAKELNGPLMHPEFFRETISQNREMFNVFHYIETIAPSSQPVLISGETGVGKELASRSIHKASGRHGSLVAVNVAGLDDEVFSDTLFGHTRGAYTGAGNSRDGQVKKAAAGTLFLDEIGDLSMKSQVKLLRLLQEKEYLPLGADTPQKSDARIIVATNQDLAEQVKENCFRKDLYFRLYAHHVALPPLRRRFDDLPLLVPHFVRLASRDFGKKELRVPKELYPFLENYTFPGNIRELKAMIFDAVSRQKGNTLGLDSFREHLGSAQISMKPGKQEKHSNVSFGQQLPSVKEVRLLLVKEALSRSGGNISLAARLIGLSRQSLSQFMSNHKIVVP
ncbi:MAG: sigma-54 dependent transcriptional regulator [Desulfobulbaceae bacterium]|nr:sigma-54 dependent transcriptional regulator [Desulfobulbaceae bacterium]